MLSLQDRQEIADLVSRYNWAIDHFDAQAWAATFTEDGALVANGQDRARGRSALIDYVAKRREAGKPKLRHWVTNLIAEGDGDTARLSAYVMAFRLDDGLGAPYVMGEYSDELARVDGKWLFRTRRMIVVAGASATGR